MAKRFVADRRAAAVAAASLMLALAGPAGAEPANQGPQNGDPAGVTCRIEQAPMRDGVRLATEVYLPPGDGPFPVILQRTPYNRRSPVPGSDCDVAVGRYFAARGYATLNQDTRGRYRSEGEFDAMRQEARDGYDAVEWAAGQPWSNGKVGMIGGSYVGLTQWQAAIEQPPHLVAIAPHYSSSDYLQGWTYQGGAFDLWFGLSWTAQTLAPDTLQRRLEAAGAPAEQVIQEVTAFVSEGRAKLLDDWLWQMPLKDFAGIPAGRQHRRLLRRVARAAGLRRLLGRDLDVETKYPRIRVPALVTGGWYDVFQEGTIRNFMGVRDGGRARRPPATARNWSCARSATPVPADTTAGRDRLRSGQRVRPRRGLGALVRLLVEGDRQRRRRTIPTVRLFVMVPPDAGDGRWRLLDHRRTSSRCRMPSRRASTCGASGNANTAGGQRRCSPPTGPADAADDLRLRSRAIRFPRSGATCAARNDLLPSGAFDQREVEQRGRRAGLHDANRSTRT